MSGPDRPIPANGSDDGPRLDQHDWAARVAGLTIAQRAELERRLMARLAQPAPAGASDPRAASQQRIPVAGPAEHGILSPGERRLWLLDQIEPNHPFYNMPVAAEVPGPLDRGALTAALADLCSRHQTLRFGYRQTPEGPQRSLAAHVTPTVEWEAAEGLDDRQLEAALKARARRPFDLAQPPLLRCAVFTRPQGRAVVLLVMHHIVSDGWSMGVLLRELTERYAARLAGVERRLDPLGVEFTDVCAWRRERLDPQRFDSLAGYWRRQLAGAPDALELPTDRVRPPVADFEGAVVPFELQPALGAALDRRCSAGVTPFVVLMAAYAAWLARHTGQTDLVIGTVSAGRDRPELEPLIAFLVNTLPLRVKLDDDPTFDTLIGRVSQAALGAFEHQELPFDRLIGAVAPGRDPSYGALFQTALVVQNMPLPPQDGLRLIPVDNGASKYDLTFFFWREGGRWRGGVEFATSLLQRPTIDRFIESYQTLLAGALAEPTAKTSELPVLGPTAQRALAQWNSTNRDLGPPATLLDLFDASVARGRQRVALCDGDRTFTYGELDSWRRRLAAGLQQRGVRPGECVVSALERSAESVALMLAVWTVGGVHVPVEADAPEERIGHVTAETEARFWLGSLPGGLDIAELDCSADSFVAPIVGVYDLAYILYTSGSTGRPKGAMIEHRSIVNFVRAQVERMGVGPDDRVQHAMSPAFDGGLSEVLLALCAGAALVVIDKLTTLDPGRFAGRLHAAGVTVAKFPPALLATLDCDRLPLLKTISTGGDRLTAELATKWLPGRTVLNGYGPTEATVGVAMAVLRPPLVGQPPLGPPLANMRVYVLDRNLRPVPIGVAGEICIGGAGVARGYLNRPEETAARFVADPFAGDPAARMFRTGDLGRWRGDGVVEFLGRLDDQVKLRGFRVEPGEVAAALERSPRVRQAYATVDRAGARGPRLVAYVVPAEEGATQQGEADHVGAWQSLMDQSHRAAGALRDPEFDVTGWVSTYSGLPIPKEQMRAWVDSAGQRVLALRPKHVLEIGCGSGLVLLRVAPHCASYTGTDFLQRSIQQLGGVLERKAAEPWTRGVELHLQRADELGPLAGRGFDTVVLNSVVQYFPSLDYLLGVLRLAAGLLKPGGSIFLGDLRNLRLAEAMAASVELARSDPKTSRREVQARIEARLRREEELLIDPALFDSLGDLLQRPLRCELQIKPDGAWNELTAFRYDATLRFDQPPADEPIALDASAEGASPAEIERRLQKNPAAPIAVRGLPNPRVAAAFELLEELRGGASTIESLRARYAPPSQVPPLEGWLGVAGPGHRCELRWNAARADLIDAVYYANDAGELRPREATATDGAFHTSGAVHLARFANSPVREKLAARLAPQLRAELAKSLPSYMLPSAIVVVDSLPRNASGKVDRAALPPPPAGRPDGAAAYVPPRDDAERTVADVWEQLLGVIPVGAEDDFFALGGHSMLAVQATSELESRTGVRVPLAAMFQRPTVEHIARLLGDPTGAARAGSLAPLQTRGDLPPLYCIHPAGGAVFCYLALAAHFADKRPVIGVQAVGVDGAAPPHETMDELVDHYARTIREHNPQGPYHLCGWSLGGNIAQALAVRMRSEGAQVGLLGLFDAGAVPSEEAFDESNLAPLLTALFPDMEHLPIDALRQLGPEEQAAYFTERAVQAGLVDAAQIVASGHIFRVFQKNVQAVHSHRPEPYRGELTLFRAGQQTKTSSLSDDPTLGWGPLCTSVKVHQVPSDHAQMMKPPQVDVLARLLADALAEAEAAP